MKKNKPTSAAPVTNYPGLSPEYVAKLAKQAGMSVLEYLVRLQAVEAASQDDSQPQVSVPEESRARPESSSAEVNRPTVTTRPMRRRPSKVRAIGDSDYGKNAGQEPDWRKTRKTCPRCSVSKFVDSDFGLRKHPNGRVYPQSHCYDCRSAQAKESYDNAVKRNS